MEAFLISTGTPAAFYQQLLRCLPFYAGYFMGTLVRKFGFPEYDSPPIVQQLVLCVPFSLLFVTPVIRSINVSQDWWGFAAVLGTFMVEGAFVTERAARYVNEKVLGNTFGQSGDTTTDTAEAIGEQTSKD